jgi:hypothetical protein
MDKFEEYKLLNERAQKLSERRLVVYTIFPWLKSHS